MENVLTLTFLLKLEPKGSEVIDSISFSIQDVSTIYLGPKCDKNKEI